MEKENKPCFTKARNWIMLMILVWGFVFLSVSGPAIAQESEETEESLIHWSFANQFGTGIYEISEDKTLYILRVQPRFHLDLTPDRADPSRHIYLELGVPVSVGTHRFKLGDVFQGDYPERVRQFALGAAVGLEVPVSSRWRIRPHVHFGWGTLLGEEEEKSWMYGGDFMSRFQVEMGTSDLFIINILGWYGHSSTIGDPENITAFKNALEARIPLGKLKFKGNPLYLKPHIANFWYLKEIEYLFHPEKDPLNIGSIWEIAIAVGGKEKTRLWLFNLDRVGFAVDFGDGHWGFKVVFSSLFYK